jgi:hypothetical protein
MEVKMVMAERARKETRRSMIATLVYVTPVFTDAGFESKSFMPPIMERTSPTRWKMHSVDHFGGNEWMCIPSLTRLMIPSHAKRRGVRPTMFVIVDVSIRPCDG